MPSDASHAHTHLSDDQLVEMYVFGGDRGRIAACAHCETRFGELVSGLALTRDAATLDADAVFTLDRLRDQEERILRRLERHGQPARVVTFPARGLGRSSARRAGGAARRWIAGAAAAGLLAGLFLGHFMESREGSPSREASISAPEPTAAPVTRLTAADDLADDRLLGEIEEALMSRHGVELSMLDAMTTPPELQEIAFDTR
jgi:hypothetical protein